MAIQDKFNKPNVIYKITKDIDLEGSTLTIPAGCTLDFQGGSFSNGTIVGNNTLVKNCRDKNLQFFNIKLLGTFKGIEVYPRDNLMPKLSNDSIFPYRNYLTDEQSQAFASVNGVANAVELGKIFVFISFNKTVGSTIANKNAVMITLDSNYKYLSSVEVINANHANSATYNPVSNEIIVAPMATDTGDSPIMGVVRVYDIDGTFKRNVTIPELITAKSTIRSISYDRVSGNYGLYTDDFLVTCDTNFSIITKVEYTSDRLVQQAEFRNNLFYFYTVESNKDFDDSTHNRRTVLYIKDTLANTLHKYYYDHPNNLEEPEAITWLNGDKFLTFSNADRFIIYIRVLDFDTYTHNHNLSDILNNSIYELDTGNSVDNLYVNYSFNGKSDGSQLRPYRTITEAIYNTNKAVRTVINIASGTYNEDLFLYGFNNLTINGATTTIINGSVTINNSRGVRLYNIEFHNSIDNMVSISYSTLVTLASVKVINTGNATTGIFASYTNNVILDNVTVTGTSWGVNGDYVNYMVYKFTTNASVCAIRTGIGSVYATDNNITLTGTGTRKIANPSVYYYYRKVVESTPPDGVDAVEGDIRYNSSLKKMILWNGTAWVNMDGTAL